MEPELSPDIAEVIQRGIYAKADIAIAAAELAANFAHDSSEIQQSLNEAYEYWLTNEEPYPKSSGTIPVSPRSKIIEGLVIANYFDTKRLLILSSDVRHDVRDAVKPVLNARLASESDARDELLKGIEGHTAPPRLLKDALVARLPFSNDQVSRIHQLLKDSEPKVRFAALNILTGGYLAENIVRADLQELMTDPQPEIRETAGRILAEHAEGGDTAADSVQPNG